MPSRADFSNDLEKLTADMTQMADENERLRQVNGLMFDALHYVLPLLQQGLPATITFDWTEEAIAKIQNALAAAESRTVK